MKLESKNSKRYKEAQEALDQLVKTSFPNDPFTPKDKEFLIRYSILKETQKSNDLLTAIGIDIREQKYYEKYPEVKKAREALREVYGRFTSICGRDSNAFNGFVGFLKWWCGKMDEQGEHCCFYCGVKESISKTAFKNGRIKSKKFTGGLQIDRKDSNERYTDKNCVFSCVLCNNAKSDMISADDYKKYFGKATKVFWEHISDAN